MKANLLSTIETQTVKVYWKYKKVDIYTVKISEIKDSDTNLYILLKDNTIKIQGRNKAIAFVNAINNGASLKVANYHKHNLSELKKLSK